MAYFPFQPGQQPMSSSQGVVIASDQSPVSVTGTVTATPTGNQSVSGTVNVGNFPTSQNVSGSVVGFQGTTPWVVTGSVQGVANQSVSGTVNVGNLPANQSVSGAVSVSNFPTTQNVSGSVAAWLQSSNASVITVGSPVANQSVSGTVNVGNFPTNQNVSGSVVATQGTNPWIVTANNASVITVAQSSVAVAIVSGSIAATFTPPANQSVSGTVGASVIGTVPVTQSGTNITSIVSTVPSSVIVGASIFGTAPVTQASTWIASVFGNVSVIGTVPVTQSGTWQPSALGYVTRNDAVASFLGANLTTRPLASDSAGRLLTKPFSAEESRVEGYHSVVSTSVTTLVAAAGAGLRNYITDFFIANTGATTTLVTFKDGAGSILGYTIAPAGGGSNGTGIATPIRTGANATFDFQATTATSILFATVKGFKAP